MNLAPLLGLLALGCGGERHAPPKDWQRSIDIDAVTTACLPLIGTAGSREDREGHSITRGAEIALPTAPKVLRDLGATVIAVSPVDVDIQLGTYTHPPEHDHWASCVRAARCRTGSSRGTIRVGHS